MDVLPQYKDCVMGCVTIPSRILAMKYAKAYITCEKTISSLTSQQWLTLEAAACRLPVVHYGKLAADDPRKNVVIECPKQMELLVEFVRFQEDDLYRHRVGHLSWRQVNRQNTFSHRIQTICSTMGIAHDWEEFPKASLITPTYRRNMLPSCLEKYEQQTYPNKELIIVFNGSEFPSLGDLGLNKSRDDVNISITPKEMFAGACLNYGNLLSKGKYFFRIDDDDHYGPNYVLDMVTLARSIDADLFGKPPASFIFENEKTVYSRSNIFPLTILNKALINDGKVRLGGNSISGSKYFFKKIFYSDKAYGAADSFLLYNSYFTDDMTCAIMDDMNLVAVRRKDQKTHTWKQDTAKLKQECSFTSNFIDNFI
jgi:hypothetical protein